MPAGDRLTAGHRPAAESTTPTRTGHGPLTPMTTPTSTAVTLYDTTLRDGTQGENITLSLADKLRVARMLDEYGFPFIEGGWPGSNPKDIEFFAAARKDALAARRSSRPSGQHAPPRQPARGRPQPARARRRRDAGRHDLRQELAAARRPRSWAPRRPRTWTWSRTRSRFVVDRGREAVYDAEHFFDGYRGGPRLRPGDAPGRPPGRRADPRPVRHQRRHADGRAGPASSATSGRRSRATRTRPP